MAQYGVFRMTKYKRSACYGIGLERNRTADDARNFARSAIDKELTDCNIIMHGKDCKEFDAAISRLIEKAGCKARPDSVYFCGALFTASAEFFTKNPSFVELTEEEHDAIKQGLAEDTRTKEQRMRYLPDEKMQQYFERCYSFFVRDVCQGDESRIISAKIDMDEKTPHLQLYFVPLFERENKKGISKMHLSAKDVFGNRADLRARQDRFFDSIGKEYGFERGELVDWDASPEERKRHEETHAHNRAEQRALEARQKARIEQNNELIQQQQNELARGRIKLIKQAEAADALVKSKTKRSLFQKQDKDVISVNRQSYQEAVGTNAAIKRVLDSPVYTPQERDEMQRAADAADRARREYERRAAELDALIEKRVQDRIALLNRAEPQRIKNLENKLLQTRNDLDFVVDAIKSFMRDNGFSLDDFARCYGVSLTDDHNQDFENRLL